MPSTSGANAVICWPCRRALSMLVLGTKYTAGAASGRAGTSAKPIFPVPLAGSSSTPQTSNTTRKFFKLSNSVASKSWVSLGNLLPQSLTEASSPDDSFRLSERNLRMLCNFSCILMLLAVLSDERTSSTKILKVSGGPGSLQLVSCACAVPPPKTAMIMTQPIE